ncbi:MULTISPECIES: sugar MFS transporter [Chryseobacterium]|uniref:FHS family L-fucose permease-like MFS transporter n=1 Tax=Chryseobacterium camelliae TaxID=1265445 RepID=A0ABU0TIE1_9FLAO|nr:MULTISPECIES: sugar MFS transporter [Chryseobacterium]MDT3406179.1 FHS family L-fucose permease-like MFS transporter [Pseudacidovorax intermedius]MDQ1096020.1 FHS family L-fucose permease-like MFS transporter [Chryseobacterium camelliae]MDQ1099956.1 FHS family L-fucose permease-like MFS transporter [Chryseobacterium sp. SORGH_AS_1048]MDR6087301.1 FHS family L-fucose permease-like MFS transporter [Chryseobacterium sp. SORGH_AS_0909]MDR6131676.1 FHS family L-fucose permease-like MFS transport
MNSAKFTEKKYVIVLAFVTSLFFFWAIALTMGDVLNKHFQNVLHISKSKSGLVQLSIFGAYALMGIPAGYFMKRFGYKMGVILGLVLFAGGCFLFVPAANHASFDFFRIALFILALGMATLETVAHPFVAALGNEKTSDQRVNFAQSFNGLGAIVGPLLGGVFIFGGAGDDHSLDSVKSLYTCIGIVILFLAITFSFIKVPSLKDPHAEEAELLDHAAGNDAGVPESNPDAPLWKQRHFIWAVIAQFFNIAAQGGTWAFFINYGVEKMHLQETQASYYFSLSMAMMMIGRFIGTFLMRYIAPNKLLAIFTACNIVLCLIISQSFGWVSFVSLIMLNLFLSVMYPTIFSLGLKRLGSKVQQASSFLVMAMFGGAVFPPLMGRIAETDVAHAYLLPIICYVIIILFALKYYRPKTLK